MGENDVNDPARHAAHERLRQLPAVHVLADAPELAPRVKELGRELVVEACRTVVDAARTGILEGRAVEIPGPAQVEETLVALTKPRLREVLNATGVVLHTNLGRAPLAPRAVERIAEVARSYTNLELRLEDGSRGGRDEGVEGHIRALTGAEAAFAVNNGAAAALLALAANAAGREVVVSRGELVEIGGGFRVPDVLAQSGCRLVEVGTTNRTRASDYAAALTPQTAAILKVHRSNFAIVGFTEDASIAELAQVGGAVPVLYDQGSGDLADVRRSLADGAALVTFSGDKLLGGPQAGFVVGARALVDRARRHPLARALRLDKLRFAALEETLLLWRTGQTRRIPVARMIEEHIDVVGGRAAVLAATIGGDAKVAQLDAVAGGGAHPAKPITSAGVVLRIDRPEALARLLRIGEPAVVPRVSHDAVVFDARTLADRDVMPVAHAVRRALALLAREDGGPLLRPVPRGEGEGEDALFEGRG